MSKPQQSELQLRRAKRQQEAQRRMRRFRLKRNGLLPFTVTAIITGFLAYFVYSEAVLKDGFESAEAYMIHAVAMDVLTDKGFESKQLTTTTLTVYGDEQKVRRMKGAGAIPEIELVATNKGEGIYTLTPKVRDALINVDYSFSPAQVDVQVVKAEKQHYDVMERFYGVAAEGYYIERMVGREQAVLLVTTDEALEVGYVIADMDAVQVTASGSYLADVVVLDKRGKRLDVPLVTEQVSVDVIYSELAWYKRQQDVTNLKVEIDTLEKELNERRTQLPAVTDLLQRTDLEKEVDFREKRLPVKREELVEKETGLSQAREYEENLKRTQQQQALKAGGQFVDGEE